MTNRRADSRTCITYKLPRSAAIYPRPDGGQRITPVARVVIFAKIQYNGLPLVIVFGSFSWTLVINSTGTGKIVIGASGSFG